MSHAAQMTDIASIVRFIAAGNSTFTIVSTVTGNRFTYRVRAPNKDGAFDYESSIRFVQVMTGRDNERDYSYLGTITQNGFRYGGAKAKVSESETSAKAFNYLMLCISAGRLGRDLQFWHEGRCGRCHRKLTVPQSLIDGVGPECLGRFQAIAA